MRKVFLKTVQKIFIIEETTFPLIFRIKNIKKKERRRSGVEMFLIIKKL